MFITDPDLDFLPIPVAGVKRHRIPDPNPHHWKDIMHAAGVEILYILVSLIYGHEETGIVSISTAATRIYTVRTVPFIIFTTAKLGKQFTQT
jgi:hypothetical protein